METGTSTEVEVVGKAERRRFTAEYKQKVLREADKCQWPGEIGAFLRREGLYWSNLSTWRKQRESGELAGLSARKRGPERREKNPLADRVRELERENGRLKRRAERAEGIVELQKSLGDFGDRTGRERREGLMAVVRENQARYSVETICAGLGIARASYYRMERPRRALVAERVHPRALSANERQEALGVLNSERFWDQAPGEVYATLLDEGRYLCSERTMYRILAENQQVRERRDQIRHPCHQAPELIASGPNQVWSWDITKMFGPAKWTYFYLYVILDIFSRYVVGWMLAYRESAELGKKLIEHTIERQSICPGLSRCMRIEGRR